jgi:hypothetical protein
MVVKLSVKRNETLIPIFRKTPFNAENLSHKPRLRAGVSWLLLALLLLAAPSAVKADQYDGFGYTTNDGTITIIYYTGSGGDITIPSIINDLPVISIWFSAFSSCTSLTSVTIPGSVTSIGGVVFYGCAGLTAIMVDTNNPAYSSVAGVLFNKNQTTLVEYPGGKAGSYTVPTDVTSLGSDAFGDCTSLTSVTIPNSVTSIGDQAFFYCPNLAGISFQGNAPSVGSGVFSRDDNATVYYLPGKTGWGATTFAGRPAVLWNPQFQANDASFGVRTNRFGFNITGTINIPIVVEACTNLGNSTWVPLQSCTLTNGSLYFSDPDWTNHPGRFYRIRSP